MPTRKPSKRALLSEYLERSRPARIAEAQRREIEALLAPVSESYLRGLLRGAGVPLDPLVEGVRQDSPESLERTLLALGAVYVDAHLAGDRARADETRRHVLTAKDHARLWLRRPGVSPEAKAVKEELIAWMIVWLEDPAVFPVWLALRKRKLSSEADAGENRPS